MTEHHENHPFTHCSVPMHLSERVKHPRIPFHEMKTFICSICKESLIVTAPTPVSERNGGR